MTYDTKREEALLSLLRKSGEQGLTLQDICERLTPDGKGKSTIFRLLAALTERGEIRKLPSGQGRRSAACARGPSAWGLATCAPISFSRA